MFRLDRTLIGVSGPDGVSFLQNLLTQNVENLEGVRYGALLSPQGKVITDMFLWAAGPAIVIDAPSERGHDLKTRLGLYKLRADIALEEEVGVHVVYAQDPFAGALPDPRRPEGDLGWRKLAPWSEAKAYEERKDPLDKMRGHAGVPDLVVDAQPEEVFAGEALLEELNGVDFAKGCFVGQENVSRMKRRATTRKKFCPVVFEGRQPAFGASVRAGEVEIGQIRSSGVRRALALLRLDRAFEAIDRGQTLEADGVALRLDPPSWLILPQREAPSGQGQ